MKDRDRPQPPWRLDRLIRERVHDPYKLRHKLPEPTRCPQCGAVFQNGRWAWAKAPVFDAREELCQACHRINDNYPAGEVHVLGSYVAPHRDEIIGLVRNVEQAENAHHPFNRIMDIRDDEDGFVIRTTDIHLPLAIGHALENAWEGDLKVHFDDQGYFARMEWRRDA